MRQDILDLEAITRRILQLLSEAPLAMPTSVVMLRGVPILEAVESFAFVSSGEMKVKAGMKGGADFKTTKPHETIAMRQDPHGPWSPGIALIRWPNAHCRWEAKVAFLYPNRESLLTDFDRSARWERVPGFVSRTHSLRLEKSRDGVAWVSFGIRHYLPAPLTGTSPNGNVQERPEDRISVRVFWGGINRMKAIKRMDEVEELTVIFNTFDEDGPDDIEHQARRLGTDHLGYMAGTEPIRLSGLYTLGHLALTKACRARLDANRRLSRSVPR